MFKILRAVIVVGAVVITVAAGFRIATAQNSGRSGSANGSTTALSETATVDRGDVSIAVNATGTIQANQNVPLAFTSSGKVTAVNVMVGDRVRKGQTLATIDNQTAMDAVVNAQLKVESQQLALNKLLAKPRQVDIDVAQANVNLAQAQVKEAQSSGPSATQAKSAQLNVDMAKNQLWQAQLSRDATNQKKADLLSNPRTASSASSLPSDTQNDKTISSANYNVTIAQDQLASAQSKGTAAGGIMSAQANLASAQAQLQSLTQPPNPNDVKQAQANLASAQAALTAAQQAVDQTKLMAPFDGVVAQVNLSVGQLAPATQDIVLLDHSSFYVDLPIAELDIANVKVNQPVNLQFAALPTSTIKGKVTQVSDIANTGTPVTFTVRVQLDPVGQPLLSTMSTTASIITSNAANVIRLANRFIRIDRTKNRAYATVRQADGTFKEVVVQLGSSNDTYTEIKSGVSEGDVVMVPKISASGNGGPGGGGVPGGGIRRITGG